MPIFLVVVVHLQVLAEHVEHVEELDEHGQEQKAWCEKTKLTKRLQVC